MHYILYAIPVFFLLIAIELVVNRVKNTHYYRTNDAINSLSAGVLSRMIEVVKALIPLTFYVFVFEHFALFHFAHSVVFWLLAFVLYDFCYYWNHRMGHEMSILWAAHVIHHSSEEYNLTTALRQTSSSFLSGIFYLPLALLGIEPVLLITVGTLNLIYQFWVHTRFVPKLGWLEWVLVTPSNHRVHHAQNALYIDRNYGGVFIIWDRLFGSFQEERDDNPVIFGIRSALQSWNPLYANIQIYRQLCKDSWHTKRWQDKLRVWFGRTGWRPADIAQRFPIIKTDLQHFNKFDIALSPFTKVYCVVQHSITTLIAVLLLLNINQLDLPQQLLVVAWVIYASFTLGWFMEKRSISKWLEYSKLGLLALSLNAFMLPTYLTVIFVGLLLGSVFMLVTMNTIMREQKV